MILTRPRIVLFFFFFFVIGCKHSVDDPSGEKTEEGQDVPKTVRDSSWVEKEEREYSLTHEFIRVLPNDTLKVPIGREGLCLNHSLDTLSNGQGHYDLTLIDLNQARWLIKWIPFLGQMVTRKVSETRYDFIGKTRLPPSGNSDLPYKEWEAIAYTMEIFKDHYRFYRRKEVVMNLPYKNEDLRKLENYINSTPDCKSQDWGIAQACFDKIEKYEYHLFASVLSGDKKYRETYLNLRKDISIVNAGHFSEEHAGNKILLTLLGIYSVREVDDWRFMGYWPNLNDKFCHSTAGFEADEPNFKDTTVTEDKVSNFKSALEKMTAITYELKKYEEVKAGENFMNQRIASINTYRERNDREKIVPIDESGIQTIRKAFVKSTSDMGNRLYPRADIEAWEMVSVAKALEISKAIQAIKDNEGWDEISKSPITFWQQGREIIFITPGGFYMLDRVKEIKDFLIENL